MESTLGTLLPLFFTERTAGRAVVLGVLIHTAGSTYQRPGALVCIAADGRHAGLISGGCLEGDLAEHAREVIAGAPARRITYDLRDPHDLLWGLGAGCEGEMHILLVRVGPQECWEPLTHLAAAYAAHRPTAVGFVSQTQDPSMTLGTLVFPGGAAHELSPDSAQAALERAVGATQPSEFDASGRYRLFLLPLALPPRLLLLGAGPDALPVVRLAAELHWKVTVIDHRAALASPSRFPEADRVLTLPAESLVTGLDVEGFQAAVVMTHQLQADRDYLRALARTRVPYIGLLGPAARAERLLEELGEDAHRVRERLHAPVGLDLGGRSPQAIALSIIAEILAFIHGKAYGGAPPGPSAARVQ
ncbi:MAG: XdhC family protein [Steroidobacteraceae bacterium]